MENEKSQAVRLVDVVGLTETHTRRPGYQSLTPDEARLDRSVNRKIDLTVVLGLGAGFLFLGIDKSNIGNAATAADFLSDANLVPTDVSNSVSLYSATYIPFMPVSVALARYLGPRYWIPILLISWGAVTVAHCAINSKAALYGLRLALGVTEAGYTATMYYYVGTLYPAYMAGLRMGLVSTSFAFSGAFSALIAYGIFHAHSSTWKGWQLLFIIEGAISMGIGLLCFVMFPKKLSTAWFLTAEERAHAVRRMEIDTEAVDGIHQGNAEGVDHTITRNNVVTALKDWRKILVILWTAAATVPAYGFGIFLPLIVRGMGYEGIEANLMSVPPFLLGGISLISLVWLSDHLKERSLVAAGAMFVSIIGYIPLVASTQNRLRYGFLFVIMIGAGSINPLTAAWINDNTPEKGTRAVMMGLYGLNNVAGVIAGQIFSSKYAPSYRVSGGATLGIVAFGVAGFVATRLLYMHENKRRREEIANWTVEQFEEEKRCLERRGHEKRYFMFGY